MVANAHQSLKKVTRVVRPPFPGVFVPRLSNLVWANCCTIGPVDGSGGYISGPIPAFRLEHPFEGLVRIRHHQGNATIVA